MTSGFVTEYAEIERVQYSGARARARRLVRRVALEGLSALDVVMSGTALERPRVQILYLHFVMRDEELKFRDLLTRLGRGHTFISYSEAVRRILAGEIDRPYVAFSIDDGLRNGLNAGRILRDHGVSACYFVCDSMIGETRHAIVSEFCNRELSIPAADFLSWADLETLVSQGHEIGNHSRRHKTLAALSPQEIADDIGASLSLLRTRLGDVRHFAWPRGRFKHITPEVAAQVFNAGHESCASAERGSHAGGSPRAPHETCLRRDHIIAAWPARHVRYFMSRSARTAGPWSGDWPPGWIERIARGLP